MSRSAGTHGTIPPPTAGLLRSYRILLPGLGLAALLLALPLTADGVGALTLPSVVLLVSLGSASLLTSAGTVRWLPAAPHPVRAGKPRPERQPFSPPVGALGGGPRRARSPSPRVPRAGPRPLAPLLGSADFIWEAVQTPVVGSLPVELVGPVADMPYVPADALDPNAFTVYGARSSVEIEVPAATVAVMEAPIGRPSYSWPPPTEPREIVFGPRREFLDLEALTPIPPHLRPSAPPTKSWAAPRAPDAPRAGCATCDRSLGEAPNWQRCTVCQDPLCSDCLVRALVEQERAWCRGCSEWDMIEESYRSMNTPESDRRSAS